MKVFSLFAVLMTLVLTSWKCGYTVLKRDSSHKFPCIGEEIRKLPDLAITDISAHIYGTVGITVEHFPEEDTRILITIRNVGTAPFAGSVLVNYADNEGDISQDIYPLHGKVVAAALPVEDSIVVRLELLGRWDQSGVHLRFVLRTDSYPPHTYDPIYYFGREPVCEESYDNNVADYVVP